MFRQRKEGALMAAFSASEGANLCGGNLCGPDAKLARTWRSDSREVATGDGFIAVKGAVTDGHLFIEQAIARGAKIVLADEREVERLNLMRPEFAGISFICVSDTQRAFAVLAQEYLRRVDPNVVAITGSVGKTTVRELTAAALKTRCRVHSAVRSFNTIIGCSMTILAMPEDTETLVLELGTNHFGEIKEMVELFPPETAVVTEVAPAHLEGFGSVEGVLRAKMEICGSRKLRTIIYNYDNGLLKDYMSYNFNNIKKIGVGGLDGADVVLKSVKVSLGEDGPKTSAIFNENGKIFSLSSSLFGAQHGYSMGLAYAAAELYGVSQEEAWAAFSSMQPIGGRGVCKKCAERGWVIDEAYNANPASMSAAVKNTREAANSLGVKKCAVLGGMRELGERSAEWHRTILSELEDFDSVLLLGREWAECGVMLHHNAALCASLDELVSRALMDGADGRLILVKGSNSYGLSKVVAALTEK